MTPRTSRIHYNDYVTGYEIIIPYKAPFFAFVILVASLAGGGLAIYFSQVQQPAFSGPAPSVWAIFVCITLLLNVYNLLWYGFGKEYLVFEGEEMIHTRQLFFFRKSRSYYTNIMLNLRANEDVLSDQNGRMSLLQVHGGTIKFDYGRDTVRIAQGANLSEAQMILDQLTEKGFIPKVRH